MPTKPIPVIALTGFLGAGKTTLMNHLLEHNHGLKIGVVVNDYGDINIDAQLIGAQTDATLELTNGCICCSLDSMELSEAIGQFAYPKSPIDYIVIEASGLAEPADLASTLRGAMTELTILDSIVAVIDAEQWQVSPRSHAAVKQQIQHSDFVVINKVDLVGSAQLGRIKAFIDGINSRVRVFTASHADIDIRLLLDHEAIEPAPNPTPPHDHGRHQHLHEHYGSLSFTSSQPLDPAAFQSFVNRCIPTSIYRSKGIVNLGAKGHNRKYQFQLVGKRVELTWTAWGDEAPRTALVFIGQDLDEAGLRNQLASCIDPKPDSVTSRPIILPRHRR